MKKYENLNLTVAPNFFRDTAQTYFVFGTLVPEVSKLNLGSLSSSIRYDQRVDKVENWLLAYQSIAKFERNC